MKLNWEGDYTSGLEDGDSFVDISHVLGTRGDQEGSTRGIGMMGKGFEVVARRAGHVVDSR